MSKTAEGMLPAHYQPVRYVLTTPVREQTPEQFYEYVLSLRRISAGASESKAAKGIKLHVQDSGKVIIRCTRDTKQVTLAEIENLAIEYEQNQEELYKLFNERKFNITNESGETLNVKPKRTRAKRATKRTEADAHIEQNRQQADRSDQLFFSGTDTNLSAQSTLQPEPQATPGS
jgi:hypothetical protein